MCSTDLLIRIDAVLERFERAQDVFFASLDSLTAVELVAALDRYGFLLGRLDALIYELSSPFGPPRGRPIWR
ncbi:hypothetical protein [Mycobacterium sp. E3305]|uniref:hypothetical protein n=1 Tax=Mycobacterium sp. E3305 TaxID=1834145 RepID=UPI0007FB8CDF|nr:hypothetical protein [Mycobacterium sp. E3305]OBG71837.1 hypothetical protein A5701_26640 [Mycobacterium sp. E3305]